MRDIERMVGTPLVEWRVPDVQALLLRIRFDDFVGAWGLE